MREQYSKHTVGRSAPLYDDRGATSQQWPLARNNARSSNPIIATAPSAENVCYCRCVRTIGGPPAASAYDLITHALGRSDSRLDSAPWDQPTGAHYRNSPLLAALTEIHGAYARRGRPLNPRGRKSGPRGRGFGAEGRGCEPSGWKSIPTPCIQSPPLFLTTNHLDQSDLI